MTCSRYPAVRLFTLLVLAAWAQSCASGLESVRTGAVLPDPVLASFGSKTLSEADLPEASMVRLRHLDDVYVQERFNIVWAGLEDAIGTQLLARAAQSQRLSTAGYIAREIDAKVGSPSNSEVRGLYEANRSLIDVPFEEAEPVLRREYIVTRREALRRALVDQLRAENAVQLSLPPPDLTRQVVEAVGPSLGSPRAAATLVIFSDFACPFSAQARRLAKRLNEMYPDHLRIVHRNLPLARHKDAQRAAEVSVCAAEQGHFWPFAELLFENAKALTAEDLLRYARSAELDAGALAKCMSTSKPKMQVERDIVAARGLGVTGTPAMFLNGMYLRGVLPLPVISAFIDRELKEAGIERRSSVQEPAP